MVYGTNSPGYERSRVRIVYIGYEQSRVRIVQGTNSLETLLGILLTQDDAEALER